MSPEMLVLATGCTLERADAFAGPLTLAMAAREISTPLRQAHFLAQCAHESALFARLQENLNYSAEGLVKTWEHRFYLPPAVPKPGMHNALEYAHDPRKIANEVYANRLGNGPPASEDGFRFRGRGVLQLTGRYNYMRFNEAEPSLPVVTYPDTLMSPEGAARSAAWFWFTKNCNEPADRDETVEVSKLVNGVPPVGLEQRIALTRRARAALGALA